MLGRISALMGLCLVGVSQARAEDNKALPATVDPYAVLSVVTADWNNDGGFDRAVLVQGEDDEADLYVYLSDTQKGGETKIVLALQKRDAAWRGSLWGTQPSLEVSDKGALLIKSENDAVGRGRWSQVLTIVYRNNEFTVAGVTFNSRDTLDPKATVTCDLNLLNGQGIRNGRKIAVATKSARLADWNDNDPVKECN